MKLVRSTGRRRAGLFLTAAAVMLAAVAGSQAVAAVSEGTTTATPSAAERALAACSNVKRGGTLTYGVSQDVISFDAANTQDNGSLWTQMNVYDQLLRISPFGSKVLPGLAVKWTAKKGGREYVFNLRRNARFSDGTPVTAEDVKFSFDRTRSKKSAVSWTLEAVKSVRAVDRYTVQVTLTKPWAPFLSDITLWGASIMSKKAVQRLGVKIKTQPVGSGPFSVAEFKPGQYVVLKRNPYYWQKDACGNTYPYLDQVRLEYIPNATTRMTKLQSGGLDVAIDVPYNQIKSLDARAGITAKAAQQLGALNIALSQRFGPFKNVKVRQAMNYAIDRQAIVKAVFFGYGIPAKSPISTGVNFWTGKYGYKYNLARAKQLMKESGVGPFSTTMLTISGDVTSQAVSVIVQNQLKQIGITVKLQAFDNTTWFGQIQQKKTEMAYGYGTSDNLDPNANMLFCCVSDGGADAWFTDWKDVAADALAKRSQAELNVKKRAALLDQWQKILMQRGPVLWLVSPTNRYVYRDNVHGFRINPVAQWPLWLVWKS